MLSTNSSLFDVIYIYIIYEIFDKEVYQRSIHTL